jgi:hypothetical protein
LVFGYSLNYVIRQNQRNGDFIIGQLPDKDSYKTSNKYNHALLFGIRKDIGRFSGTLNYHLPMNLLAFAERIGISVSLSGFQFTLGYMISD